MSWIDRVIKCPKRVSASGKIRIVGDQRHCQDHIVTWKLLAVDPGAGSQSFAVTEEEVEKWVVEYGEVTDE